MVSDVLLYALIAPLCEPVVREKNEGKCAKMFSSWWPRSREGQEGPKNNAKTLKIHSFNDVLLLARHHFLKLP